MDDSWSRRLSQGSSVIFPGEEDQVDPCEQLDVLSLFDPSSKTKYGKRYEKP